MDEEIKKGINYLMANFRILGKEEIKKIFLIKEKSIAINFIEAEFEDEDGKIDQFIEKIEVSKDSFLKSVEELKSFKLNEAKTILATNSSSFHLIDNEIFSFYNTSSDQLKINGNNDNSSHNLSIVRNNLTIILSISELTKTYEIMSLLSYGAIKFEYQTKKEKLSEKKESEIVDLLTFELFAKEKFYIEKNYVWHLDDDEYLEQTPSRKFDTIEIRTFEDFNEGISLFLSALQVFDPELKMLSLYKVIEYFGPIVVKLEGNELLRKKLDSNKIYNPDGEFLNSIFDLINSTEIKKRDKEIPKAILLNCVDLIELIKFLPKSTLSSINSKSLTYKSKKQDLDKARNIIADTLYSTRNKVAHAKSNFTSSDYECPDKDLPKLNEFLVELCQRTIRWYNRLPEHQK